MPYYAPLGLAGSAPSRHLGAAVAPYTSDADLVLNPRMLADNPKLEALMRGAGFVPASGSDQGGRARPPSGSCCGLRDRKLVDAHTGSHEIVEESGEESGKGALAGLLDFELGIGG